jgi:CPA1 family monovalent cation:H+ antiporter
MRFEILFVLLVATAASVALVARYFKFPYTVALVLAGLLLGTTHALPAPTLTKDLLYAVFLPGLLFEAAFHLEFRRFVQNKIAIVALAVPGVIAAVALTALILTPAVSGLGFATGFTLLHGLVLASLLAATDPIAVVALFKSLGVPKRLLVLVEGESLLNDGTAVVIFTMVLALASGGELSWPRAVLQFATVVGMGAVVGTVIGFGIAKVIQRVDDPMIEITLTTIAAYGSFVAAEELHYSGVIATVVAGMLCGNYAARTGMSPTTRIAVEAFWEYVAFALNSFVFLLIGFEVHVEALLASWKPIAAAWFAVTAGRALVVYGVSGLLKRTSERLPWSWSAVLTWGGLRGGLSMVLALSLAPGFPHRDLLITMTFGVVIVSILAQGLTMPALLRRLALVGGGVERRAFEIERARVRAARAALDALDGLERDALVAAPLAKELRAEYVARVQRAEEQIEALHVCAEDLRDEEMARARRQLIMAEKDALVHAARVGQVSPAASEEILRDVDARLVKTEAGTEEDEGAAVGAA